MAMNPKQECASYERKLRVAHVDHLADCWKVHILGIIVEGSRGVGVHHIVVIVAASHIVKQICERPNITVQHLVPHVERADLTTQAPSSVLRFERANLYIVQAE